MQTPQDVITCVLSFFEINGLRLVETIDTPEEDKNLARAWRDLLRRKQKLSAEVRGQAESLEVRMVITSVTSWYEKSGRRPSRGRDSSDDEKQLARTWRTTLGLVKDKESLLSACVREQAEYLETLMSSQYVAKEVTLDAVNEWMMDHKRYPQRDRDGEEGVLAQKWKYLRSLKSSHSEVVVKGVKELEKLNKL